MSYTYDSWGSKYQEISISAAWDLGYTKANARSGPSGNFEMILFPETKKNWSIENLQQQVNKAGGSIY